MKEINLNFSFSFEVPRCKGLPLKEETTWRPAGITITPLSKFDVADFSFVQPLSYCLVDFRSVSFPKSGKRRFCFPGTGQSTFFLRKRFHNIFRNRLVGVQGMVYLLHFLRFSFNAPLFFSSLYLLKLALFNWRVIRFFPKRFRKIFLFPTTKLSFFLKFTAFRQRTFLLPYYFCFWFTHQLTFQNKHGFYTLKALLSFPLLSTFYPLVPFKKRPERKILIRSSFPLISSFPFKTPLKKRKKNAAVR